MGAEGLRQDAAAAPLRSRACDSRMADQQRLLRHGSVDRDSPRGLPEACGGPELHRGEPGAADASG
eukprot:7576995-Pyramimonas_sp.AAC.1